jgi:hypothetical protein
MVNDGPDSTNGSMAIQVNGDTGANYGYQFIDGNNATTTAARTTGFTSFQLHPYSGPLQNELTLFDWLLYAKSGKIRTALLKQTTRITGTTVGDLSMTGECWNNTVDNITYMRIYGSTGQPNPINVGSRLILLKKRELTSGTKTGEIDPQGTTYGHWQLIYDNTLTAAKTNLMLTSQMDSYTKLLIHADGADTSTAFYDFSNSAHAITANGNAQVDTAYSKFGGASALFDGTGDYLTVPDSDDFYFGTSDFTIDFWVRFNSISGSQHIFSQRVDDNNRWGINKDANDKLNLYFYSGGVGKGVYVMTNAWSGLSTGVWYHVVMERNNGCRMFIDGVQQTITETVAFGTNDVGNLAANLVIGAYGNGAEAYLNGWLDEISISKGIARWTANFTPPTRAYNELDGDRDVVYKIIFRNILGASGAYSMTLRPNNDTATNYGYQRLYGASTSVGADRASSGQLGVYWWTANNVGEIDYGEQLWYVKSGNIRPVVDLISRNISGTTVTALLLSGQVWNNTTDNIRNINIYSYYAANGLGIGTHVECWRLNL